MQIRFRKGAMPRGGTYEDFAVLLARFYRTFEPLKDRGGEDARDFIAIRTALIALALNHSVLAPQQLLAEEEGLTGYATPLDVSEHLAAIVRDFGLCHPEGCQDDLSRTLLGRTILNVLRRYKADAAADDEPMDKVLDPQRKERSRT